MNRVPESGRTPGGLSRALKPQRIALIGLSDESPYLRFVERTVSHSAADLYFINPRRDTVMGHKAYSSLKDVPSIIDVAYSVANASVTTECAEEAVDLSLGGLIVVAGGFAEIGREGFDRQKRLSDAARAGGFPVIGPNCLGVINVRQQISLAFASDHRRRAGGISVVSQSGAVLNGVSMAAWARPAIGLNVLVSAGNEAVTDLADYVDYFADDPDTTSIGLVIETLRRPEKFFAAARKALEKGKPIVAVKLARSARTQELAASHTGALTGDSWVYDVAFRQLGIGIARDCDELIDRLALIDQLGAGYRSEVEKLAILTMSGGLASMTMDIATEENVEVPSLDEFRPWISDNLPGASVPNPLDATGMGEAKWPEIVQLYGSSSAVDGCILVHPLADEDEAVADSILKTFVEASETYGKPFVVSNCASTVGGWAHELAGAHPGVAIGHGPRQSLRGLDSLNRFVRARRRLAEPIPEIVGIARPNAPTLDEPEGHMLPFTAAMELLEAAGIPVAPYSLVPPGAELLPPPFAGPYVVKLADVAHRTEHGAVRVGVTADLLAATVDAMREIARGAGLPELVVIQSMVESHGEAFIGITNGELGPMVVFGLGGVLIEVLNKIGGRMAPFGRREAESLIAEFEDAKVMHGFRGQRPWNLDLLAGLLVSTSNLASSSSKWLESLDINPLVVTENGFVAVDALFLMRSANS